MEFENIISGKNLVKKYKGFTLAIDSLEIPKGFAVALIGENGAGKSTLLNMMGGLRLDFKGEFTYFDGKGIDDEGVRGRIGFTAPNNFFFPNWTTAQVKELNSLLFPDMDADRYDAIVDALDIPVANVKTIKGLSDGNKVKLMLAGVLARKTDMLILDEPASPLDPLMRSKLCDIIQKYLEEGNGQRTVFFSTHNIADMESITDYAILLDKGHILEQGFVVELKEKYMMVKGDAEDFAACKNALLSYSKSSMGFEGLILAENLEKLAGINVSIEKPTLSQICVGLMKAHSSLKDI